MIRITTIQFGGFIFGTSHGNVIHVFILFIYPGISLDIYVMLNPSCFLLLKCYIYVMLNPSCFLLLKCYIYVMLNPSCFLLLKCYIYVMLNPSCFLLLKCYIYVMLNPSCFLLLKCSFLSIIRYVTSTNKLLYSRKV